MIDVESTATNIPMQPPALRTLPVQERLVFAHTVSSLFDFLAQRNELTPDLIDRVRSLGIDLSKTLLPAYALELWNEVLQAVAETLYPADPIEVAARRLGEHGIGSYEMTMIGRATLAMSKLIGPRRTVLRAQHSWRTANNHTVVTVTEFAPNDFRVVFNTFGVSRWVYQGINYASLKLAGAENLSFEIESYSDESVIYRARWK